jgi:hypothetical protein
MIPAALALAMAACQPAANEGKADAAVATPHPSAMPVAMTDAQLIERGDYIVRIAGCNDCHTPGYPGERRQGAEGAMARGHAPGLERPVGHDYPANLRLKAADMDDAQWLAYTATLHTRPPMPDFAVRDMSEQDRLAILRFVKSLGAGGRTGAGLPAAGGEAAGAVC